MPRFWLLVFKGLAPVLQIRRNLEKRGNTDFIKDAVFKQHFVVQNSFCIKVYAHSKRQRQSGQDSSKEGYVLFSFGRNRHYLAECHIILLGNSCMPQIQHFLREWRSSLNKHVQLFIAQCNRLKEVPFLLSCIASWKPLVWSKIHGWNI